MTDTSSQHDVFQYSNHQSFCGPETQTVLIVQLCCRNEVRARDDLAGSHLLRHIVRVVKYLEVVELLRELRVALLTTSNLSQNRPISFKNHNTPCKLTS